NILKINEQNELLISPENREKIISIEDELCNQKLAKIYQSLYQDHTNPSKHLSMLMQAIIPT
ncbi:MAG: hypothetical protein MJZ46_06280, partial [Bacteroidales bacterium]|nr:hypothetical protein [Bacteroidales bacterium]